jgi:nucleoside-diphosphate-sugar epimerase
MSDGTPWRPIIHIEDLCRAFLAILEAPTDLVYNQIFNVGIDEENYQIEDIANEIEKILPNTAVEILNRTGPDERTYRVDFSKIKRTINQFKPVWDLKKGIEELYSAYKNFGLTRKDFDSNKYFRIRWIKYLLESKKLDRNLRYLKKK